VNVKEKPHQGERKKAKKLLKSWRDGDIDALVRVQKVYVQECAPCLMKAQHVIAVERGYRSWRDMLESKGGAE